MPYCSKCGVEVDNNVRKCPLCDFSIPIIEIEENEYIDRFPLPQNIYPKKVKRRKRKAFIIISVIFLSVIGLILFQNITASGKLAWAKYSIVSVIAAWIYLYFFFGFIPNFRISLIGVSTNTIILLFFIDVFNGKLEWIVSIGFPCVFMGALEIIIIAYLIERTKKKGLNIVTYILLSIALYCIGIEAFISLYTKEYVKLYWSIIVTIALTPLSILFIYLHYGLPEKYKIKLKRKFHI